MSRPGAPNAMIEVDTTLEEGIVAVRFHGAVTDQEFAELAAMIADFGSARGLLIFLDWFKIDRWDFSAPNANLVAAWRRAGRAIGRAAIVHDSRTNRQAAWLAAILRKQGVTVRSWRPQDAAAAAAWLCIHAAEPPG
jgi:SpoIIAA-like